MKLIVLFILGLLCSGCVSKHPYATFGKEMARRGAVMDDAAWKKVEPVLAQTGIQGDSMAQAKFASCLVGTAHGFDPMEQKDELRRRSAWVVVGADVQKVEAKGMSIEFNSKIRNGWMGEGLAVAIHPEGYYLTAHHVVHRNRHAEPSQLLPLNQLSLETQELRFQPARLVWADRRADLALLKGPPTEDYYAVSTPERPPEWVVCRGSGPWPSMGKVDGIVKYRGWDYLRHDAPLKEGDSGGAVADADGNLLGVNTHIVHIPFLSKKTFASIPDAERLRALIEEDMRTAGK